MKRKTIEGILLIIAVVGLITLLVGSDWLGDFLSTKETDEETAWETIPTPTPTPTPAPTPELSNTEKVKLEVAKFLMPTYSYYARRTWGGIEPENSTMTNLALENSIRGTNSLKIIGNTPEEAINVFKLYQKEHSDLEKFQSYEYESGDDLSYGLAVSQFGKQYNICVVFSITPPATAEPTGSGAYKLVQPEDKIKYLWD